MPIKLILKKERERESEKRKREGRRENKNSEMERVLFICLVFMSGRKAALIEAAPHRSGVSGSPVFPDCTALPLLSLHSIDTPPRPGPVRPGPPKTPKPKTCRARQYRFRTSDRVSQAVTLSDIGQSASTDKNVGGTNCLALPEQGRPSLPLRSF